MNWEFKKVLDTLSASGNNLLIKGRWGIERESQRVAPDGELALTEHPSAFGSKLENTEITTDFSESQLELITPPFPSVEEAHNYLKRLTSIANNELKQEFLWPLSMPPRLPDEDIIPLARFEDTPEGREKEIYREGLARRYGKKMQMISGIHFNFSFSEEMLDILYNHFRNDEDRLEFTDKVYFSMARNFLRYRWLLIYLFGASPSADYTYYPIIKSELKTIKKCCPECCTPLNSYNKYAASLRVSRFGYSNPIQGRFWVSYNTKTEYLQSIRKMLTTKSRKYSQIGTFEYGKQIQLNENILQKDSEFYSSIRLKQPPVERESQLDAIEKRGVKYAEVRILDLNPFDRTGISLEQMRFLQLFMLFCLFESSSFITRKEFNTINKNHHLVALAARNPNLMLYLHDDSQILVEELGKDIFTKLFQIAKAIDNVDQGNKYTDCVSYEFQKLSDKSLLPSSKMQNEMNQTGESFIAFGMRKAKEYKNQNNIAEVLNNVE